METKRKEIDRRLMPGLVADALVFPYLSFAGAIVGRRGPWYGVENSGGASSFFGRNNCPPCYVYMQLADLTLLSALTAWV